MEKKIFDILPPKERKKNKVLLYKKSSPKKSKIKISSSFWKVLITLLIFLVLGGVLSFNLSRVEIEIWPKTEILTFKTELEVDKEVEKIDLLDRVIPGKIFEVEKTYSQEFPATGKKLIEKAAKGTIRVYNNYHLDQTLIKYTRFQPPSKGKVLYFCTTKDLVIPAKSYRDVEVFACQEGGRYAPAAGEEYNIGPSTFSIPGLAGTPRYTACYGKSFQSMTGGLRKEVSVVKKEDLEKGEKIVKERAEAESEIFLKNKIPPEFVFLKEASETKILEVSSSAKAGNEQEKFNSQARAKSITLSFKKEDIENFAKQFVLSKISKAKKINPKSLKVDYFLREIDLGKGKMVLSLNIKAEIYSDINKISLKEGLVGKSLNETKLFLESQPQIKKVSVRLWPFWLKRVPKNLKRIKIKINLD